LAEPVAIDTGTEQLLCALQDGVATITLNRPQARNALSNELTPALRRMIRHCAEDDAVGAVLLTGAGTAFCAGGDVKGMSKSGIGSGLSFDAKVADLRQRQRTLTGALVALRKPTIAALPGPAAGAGLAIALACDIRIAADTAFVSTGYARIGLSGDYGIAWLLSRVVGNGRARELMFTADRIDATTCERIGLVNRVVPGDALADEAFAFAKRLAAGPRQALGLIKDNLDAVSEQDFLAALDGEAERLLQAAASEDHKEAVRAFVEKREPVFGAANRETKTS
jgi:enoyl-CoA hydratase/carnithine racemase